MIDVVFEQIKKPAYLLICILLVNGQKGKFQIFFLHLSPAVAFAFDDKFPPKRLILLHCSLHLLSQLEVSPSYMFGTESLGEFLLAKECGGSTPSMHTFHCSLSQIVWDTVARRPKIMKNNSKRDVKIKTASRN